MCATGGFFGDFNVRREHSRPLIFVSPLLQRSFEVAKSIRFVGRWGSRGVIGSGGGLGLIVSWELFFAVKRVGVFFLDRSIGSNLRSMISSSATPIW